MRLSLDYADNSENLNSLIGTELRVAAFIQIWSG